MQLFHEMFDESLSRLGPGTNASTNRALSTLLLLTEGALALRRDDSSRKAASVLLVLLASEVTLGTLMVLTDFSPVLAVSHGAFAAVVLATVATLLGR